MTVTTCADCGAQYEGSADSCASRFDALLALDHSRQEPWGSRHGLAFAVFALQHPTRYPAAIQAQSVEMLRRVYVDGETLPVVVRDLRQRASGARAREGPPPVAPQTPGGPFPITIADLGRFEATGYPAQLDAWCRSTLAQLQDRGDAP